MTDMTGEQALNEVRKSFERWAPTAGMLIDRDKEGKYEQAMTRHYWLVWQAAKSDTEVAAVVMADPDGLSDLLAGKRDNTTIYRTKNDWKAGVPLFARPALSAPRVLDIDALAQIIREVDGRNSLGAGALAEMIIARLSASPEPVAPRPAAWQYTDTDGEQAYTAIKAKALESDPHPMPLYAEPVSPDQQVIDDLRQQYDTLLAKHQDVLDEVQLCGCAYDGPQDVCIGHAKVIADLRAEVEALKAVNSESIIALAEAKSLAASVSMARSRRCEVDGC